MVSYQSIGAGQDLFLVAGAAKANQAVGRCHRYRARFGVRQDSIHAEDVFVFDVGCTS
jgi:hypothetical protein